MPYNGTGTFTRVYNWVQDALNGIKIRADRMDAEFDGVATALSNCITRDGQGKPSAAIDWNGQDLTNIADLMTDVLNGFPVQTPQMVGAVSGADCTDAFLEIMDQGGWWLCPPGDYKLAETIEFKHSNTRIVVPNRGGDTIFRYTGTTGPVFDNVDPSTTLLWCELSGMQILATGLTSSKILVNWRGMQLGDVRRVWLHGPNSASSWGLNVEADYGVSEATYNTFSDLYIGAVDTGVRLYDGANSNIIRGGRIQLGRSGANSILLSGSATNRCNSNTIDSVGMEYPGAVSNGVNIASGTDGTRVINCRFESLAYGVLIAAGAENVWVPHGSNYFSGCTNNIFAAEAPVPSTFARISFDGTTGALRGLAYNASVSRTGTGAYTVTLPAWNPDANYNVKGFSSGAIMSISSQAATSFVFVTQDAAGVAQDHAIVSVEFSR